MLRYSAATTILPLLLLLQTSASTISLKAGDYGAARRAFYSQSNAATMSFDGRRFSYPHASKAVGQNLASLSRNPFPIALS